MKNLVYTTSKIPFRLFSHIKNKLASEKSNLKLNREHVY